MSWVPTFYRKQGEWSGVYHGPVTARHRQKASIVERMAGPGPHRVLELGAGGGQAAAALVDAGHQVVALELVDESATHARLLAAKRPNLFIVKGDFYIEEVGGMFDLVVYWDGFGVGSDDDQRRLLRRIAQWLHPGGRALIDVYTPWYAAKSAGHGHRFERCERVYGFDAEGCRWLDKWWPLGKPDEAVEQSLRCYAPADLRLLLEGTGLTLHAVAPGGGFDWKAGVWKDEQPLGSAMSYLAILRPEAKR